ncbi:MAG: hypothetical protein FLV1_gp2 [Fushun levivirus 1]|nr:MAG: hypothetical protein FLV1_gp2 [Fushun levivirus 1]
MPSMADIVVKAANGTTDVTYTAKSPSAGNGVPAIWRNQSVGSAPSHMPELRLAFRDSPNGAERRGRATFVYPQIATDTTTSLVSVVNKAIAGMDITLPKGMSSAAAAEFGAQLGNLLATALIKSCNSDGYAPT